MTRLSNFEKYKIDHAVQQQFSKTFRDQNVLDDLFLGLGRQADQWQDRRFDKSRIGPEPINFENFGLNQIRTKKFRKTRTNEILKIPWRSVDP